MKQVILKMNFATKLSIIIPTYNRHTILEKTLKYLGQLSHRSCEIIVVDQSEKFFEKTRWESNPKIRYFHVQFRGLPRARNFGLSKARGDIIIFCDDDIIPTQHWLEAHEKNYDDPLVGGVAGRIIENNGESHARDVGKIHRFTGRQTDNFNSDIPGEVDHGMGCNLSFRADVLSELHGFDTRFGGTAFLEETDACLRMKKLGYQLMFEPAATVIHLKEENGGCRPRSKIDWYYWYGHNYSLLFFKNFSRASFPVFMMHRLFNIIAGGLKNRQTKIIFHGLKGMMEGIGSYFRTDPIYPNRFRSEELSRLKVKEKEYQNIDC